MGRFYYLGWAVSASKPVAAFWLMLAVAGGNAAAMVSRNLIISELSGAELIEVERLAIAWRPVRH